MSGVRATLSTGEEAELVALEPAGITLRSVRPFAPGAPLAATVHLETGDVPLVLKCHGSKRGADGAFTIRGRAVSMLREHRERLEGALGAGLTPS